MFTGSMIDDLIRTVEQTEQHTQTCLQAWSVEPEVEVYPLYSTYVYQWQGMEPAIAGVA